jgi:hypothetical protein
MNIPLDEQNIIGLLGIQDLPEERKLAMLDKITALVEKRLLVRIFDSLNKPEQEMFESLLENQDQNSVNTFLEQRVPDLAQWVEEEALSIKKELQNLNTGLEEDKV